MKNSLFASLFAVTTVAGTLSQAAPATAFTWNNHWAQPTILPKSQTEFNDAPFQAFVQAERVALPNSGLFVLDPSQLKLKYDHNVSVHFINEGAGYRNQLAYKMTGAMTGSGLLFKDISSAESVGAWGGDALDLGDSVNMGTVKAGTQLDFWLRADGYNRPNNANIFGTQTASNADGLQHVIAYAYQNYLLLGFEDLYGDLHAGGIDPETGKANEHSDRDFNDAIFVVDVGEQNVRALTQVPEPSVVLSLMAGAAAMAGLRRKARCA